jgi:hypothetical protein
MHGIDMITDMNAKTSNIASWEAEHLRSYFSFHGQNSIATEGQSQESPEWAACMDALLKIWTDAAGIPEPRPNRSAIEAAMEWIAYLREHFPSAPPTCIVPEPDGGVIIERRETWPSDCVCELTFYNNGSAERTDYVQGRVVFLGAIPQHPRIRSG